MSAVKKLEIKVTGVGDVKIIRNGSATTIVEKWGFINYYEMPFEEVKNMIYKRLNRDYPDKSKLITPRIY